MLSLDCRGFTLERGKQWFKELFFYMIPLPYEYLKDDLEVPKILLSISTLSFLLAIIPYV